MKISELNLDERPREKLLSSGPGGLSNTELLAIVLRSGTGKQNAIELARDLLSSNGNRLSNVALLGADILMQKSGIGPEKAATLCAVFEIVRRIMKEEPTRNSPQISDPRMAFLYMEPRLRSLDHEEAWLLYLTRKNRLLGAEQISSGTASNTAVDVKGILSKSLAKRCSRIILLHNHPGGDPHPGEHDINFTLTLAKGLKNTGIVLADHIIIGEGGYFSFMESKILRK